MHVKILFDVIVLKFWILHLNKGQAKFSQVTRYCFATCNSRQYMYAVLLSCSCTFIFLLRIPLLRRDSREHRNSKQSPNGSLLPVFMSSFRLQHWQKEKCSSGPCHKKIQCSINNIVQDTMIGFVWVDADCLAGPGADKVSAWIFASAASR